MKEELCFELNSNKNAAVKNCNWKIPCFPQTKLYKNDYTLTLLPFFYLEIVIIFIKIEIKNLILL